VIGGSWKVGIPHWGTGIEAVILAIVVTLLVRREALRHEEQW